MHGYAPEAESEHADPSQAALFWGAGWVESEFDTSLETIWSRAMLEQKADLFVRIFQQLPILKTDDTTW